MRRRSFIAAAPAALAVPATVEAAVPEHPWEKARRLGRELSQAMADVRDCDSGGYLCVAVVYPAGEKFPLGFADIDSYSEGWAIAREFTRLPGWRDELAGAIAAYRAGVDRLNAMSETEEAALGEEEVVARTYGPAMDALAAWDAPARTAGTALEALMLASEDIEFMSGMSRTLFEAAAGYLLQVAGRGQRRAA